MIKKVYQLSFFTNGAKGQCVKVLCEYTFYQVLYLLHRKYYNYKQAMQKN